MLTVIGSQAVSCQKLCCVMFGSHSLSNVWLGHVQVAEEVKFEPRVMVERLQSQIKQSWSMVTFCWCKLPCLRHVSHPASFLHPANALYH